MCTMVLKETISYYVSYNSSVFCIHRNVFTCERLYIAIVTILLLKLIRQKPIQIAYDTNMTLHTKIR